MIPVIAGGNENHYVEHGLETTESPALSFIDIAAKYGLIVLMQETSTDELTDLNGDLPTDTHLVTYSSPEGAVGCDAVRAYKKSDIFDCYFDAGFRIVGIESGFGTIKPKLFVDKRKDS